MKWWFALLCFTLWTFSVYKLGQAMQRAQDFLKMDELEREIARLQK